MRSFVCVQLLQAPGLPCLSYLEHIHNQPLQISTGQLGQLFKRPPAKASLSDWLPVKPAARLPGCLVRCLPRLWTHSACLIGLILLFALVILTACFRLRVWHPTPTLVPLHCSTHPRAALGSCLQPWQHDCSYCAHWSQNWSRKSTSFYPPNKKRPVFSCRSRLA